MQKAALSRVVGGSEGSAGILSRMGGYRLRRAIRTGEGTPSGHGCTALWASKLQDGCTRVRFVRQAEGLSFHQVACLQVLDRQEGIAPLDPCADTHIDTRHFTSRTRQQDRAFTEPWKETTFIDLDGGNPSLVHHGAISLSRQAQPGTAQAQHQREPHDQETLKTPQPSTPLRAIHHHLLPETTRWTVPRISSASSVWSASCMVCLFDHLA
jgi:hypothetical protein